MIRRCSGCLWDVGSVRRFSLNVNSVVVVYFDRNWLLSTGRSNLEPTVERGGTLPLCFGSGFTIHHHLTPIREIRTRNPLTQYLTRSRSQSAEFQTPDVGRPLCLWSHKFPPWGNQERLQGAESETSAGKSIKFVAIGLESIAGGAMDQLVSRRFHVIFRYASGTYFCSTDCRLVSLFSLFYILWHAERSEQEKREGIISLFLIKKFDNKIASAFPKRRKTSGLLGDLSPYRSLQGRKKGPRRCVTDRVTF
jgi:hypothetical protein